VVGGQGKAPISIIVGLDGRRNPREMEVRRPGPALRDSIARHSTLMRRPCGCWLRPGSQQSHFTCAPACTRSGAEEVKRIWHNEQMLTTSRRLAPQDCEFSWGHAENTRAAAECAILHRQPDPVALDFGEINLHPKGSGLRGSRSLLAILRPVPAPHNFKLRYYRLASSAYSRWRFLFIDPSCE